MNADADVDAEQRWAAAVDQAIRDEACHCFVSVKRLLSQLPDTVRGAIGQELRQFDAEEIELFVIAYVCHDRLPIGIARTWRCLDGSIAGVAWSVDTTTYSQVIQRMRALLTEKHQASEFN